MLAVMPSPELIAAMLAPIAAGLVAVMTQRVGLAGRARRLEVMEKRIAVAQTLLADGDVSASTTQQLRTHARDVGARPDERRRG